MTANRVFISYSHDSAEHKAWVVGLATFLHEQGLEVALDHWDLDFGDDVAAFMERGLESSDFVVPICTDQYNDKANVGTGGVGYEKTIITAALLRNIARNRIVPVVRGATSPKLVPTFIGSALYLDLSGDHDTPSNRAQLFRVLSGKPKEKPARNIKPPMPSTGTTRGWVVAKRGEPFDARFSQAFPGMRGVEWFEGEAAVKRLSILLDCPRDVGEGREIWWWRGISNLHIDQYERVGSDRVLLNDVEEHQVLRIAAVQNRSDFRSFVYVLDQALPRTGLYERWAGSIPDIVADHGYHTEEYGLLDSGGFVTRAEFDDGAAMIDGEPTDIRGKVSLRTRPVTPYNWLIAPNNSPINGSPQSDDEMTMLLNCLLFAPSRFHELVEYISRLKPRAFKEDFV